MIEWDKDKFFPNDLPIRRQDCERFFPLTKIYPPELRKHAFKVSPRLPSEAHSREAREINEIKMKSKASRLKKDLPATPDAAARPKQSKSEQWFYQTQDESGVWKEEGPFPVDDMQDWDEDGYIPDDLQVR